MPISRRTIRRAVAKETGLSAFRAGAADSGGTTTTMIDAPLSAARKNEFAGAWLLPITGSDRGAPALITANDPLTGQVTYRPATTAALDNESYEILPFLEEDIYDAIDRAQENMYTEGILGREITLRGLVTGSPLFNAGFDIGTYGWGVVGGTAQTFTSAQQSSANSSNPPGSFMYLSFRGEASTTSYVAQLAQYKVFHQQLKGHRVKFHGLVRCGTASESKLRLVANGATYDSSFHSGSGHWEYLSTAEVEVDFDEELDFRVVAQDGAAVMDIALLWVETDMSDVLIPLPLGADSTKRAFTLDERNIIDVRVEPQSLLNLTDIGDIEAFDRPRQAKYDRFDWQLSNDVATGANDSYAYSGIWVDGPPGHRLYVECFVPPLNVNRTFAADADDTNLTIELTPQQSIFVAKQAAFYLLERMRPRVPAALADKIDDRLAVLNRDIERLADKLSPDTSAELPWGF